MSGLPAQERGVGLLRGGCPDAASRGPWPLRHPPLWRAGASTPIPVPYAQAAQAQRRARQEAASRIGCFSCCGCRGAAAIAKALGIGRASVYRVLESSGA